MEKDDFDESKTIEEILGDLNSNIDHYEAALKVSDRGKQVILKRKPSERFVNNYNKRFLKAFQANMDLQFCTDAYATVTYVCDNWCKDERQEQGSRKDGSVKDLSHKEGSHKYINLQNCQL